MAGFISSSDKDSLMRASYYQITRNFTKTVNRFVVFKEGNDIIEIQHGIGQRSKFIDILVDYFEELEEYEKCDKLMKLKELPQNTKIYCGHEYTKQNSNFCIAHDESNDNLKAKIKEIEIKLKNRIPTIPSTIKDELECNIFLRSPNIKTFSKLRDLKDNF